MRTELLNISGKIDSATTELLRVVAENSDKCGVEYLVVGAVARDHVLHYGYGLRIERASSDIDFAVEVGDWRSFKELRRSLIDCGFTESRSAHRLVSPIGVPIDIVPFGDLASDAGVIRWPDDPDVEMSVLGFEEARAHIGRIVDARGFLDHKPQKKRAGV